MQWVCDSVCFFRQTETFAKLVILNFPQESEESNCLLNKKIRNEVQNDE
ncbi:MAG: hypothetical protein IKI22_02845 [Neisseriaceae bacterium]|nr:hypothetical protein [Neisseriaceae bacterium]